MLIPKAVKNGFKNGVMALGLLAFFSTGFLTVNIATCNKAEAQCICGLRCTKNAGSTLFNDIVIGMIIKDISLSLTELLVDFELRAIATGEVLKLKAATIGNNFEAWVDTFWFYNLEPTLKQITAQLVARDVWQAEVLAEFITSQEVNRNNLEESLTRLEEQRQYKPSETVCMAATNVGGMMRVNKLQEQISIAAPVEAVPRSSAGVLANGTASPAALGAAADKKDRWQQYVNKYCDPNENGGSAGCTVASPLAGRDIDVTGEIFSKDTIDIKGNPNDLVVVNDLVTNLAEPFVKEVVLPGALLTSPGQDEYLKGESYKAKRQAIYSAMHYIISRRYPGSVQQGGQSFLSEIRSAANVHPSRISKNPSKNEIMNVMLSERFRTGTFGKEQLDEPENNEQELVVQQAFQAIEMNDMLDLLDRYALVLAARAGDNVRDSKPMGDAMSGMNAR